MQSFFDHFLRSYKQLFLLEFKGVETFGVKMSDVKDSTNLGI